MIHFKKTAWLNLNLLENTVKTHFCCFGNIVLRCRWVRGNWWWPEFLRLPGSISMHIWPARFCAPNSPRSGVSGNFFLLKMINCKEFPVCSPLLVKSHDNLIVHYSFGTFLDGKWLMSFVYFSQIKHQS